MPSANIHTQISAYRLLRHQVLKGEAFPGPHFLFNYITQEQALQLTIHRWRILAEQEKVVTLGKCFMCATLKQGGICPDCLVYNLPWCGDEMFEHHALTNQAYRKKVLSSLETLQKALSVVGVDILAPVMHQAQGDIEIKAGGATSIDEYRYQNRACDNQVPGYQYLNEKGDKDER